jgi:RimJ/RimL family protein N-acetyltransferase
MLVIETERLILRQLSVEDAEFILALLNEPSFLRCIGDKKVHDRNDAQQYILTGPIASYKQHGFGLYLVELKGSRVPIGMCGLLKREELPDVDIGFAFLPNYWNQGFASEAAAAVLKYAQQTLNLKRLVAITNPDNDASIKLLQRLGFTFESVITRADDRQPVKLFGKPLCDPV